jgi:hypothetical protein
LGKPGSGEVVGETVVEALLGESEEERLMRENVNRLGRTGAGFDWLSGFEGRRPDILSDPGLDPYYDRAKERAMSDISREMAALGAYGSSTAQQMRGEALTDLSAEQANREADFRLRALAEGRGWEALGGQFAGQTESMDFARSQAIQDALSRMDEGERADFMGALQAGVTGQQLEMGREVMPFDMTMQMLPYLLGVTQGGYGGMSEAVFKAMEQAYGADAAASASGVGAPTFLDYLGRAMGIPGAASEFGTDTSEFLDKIGI